ncbi:Por secretion system C-terminal sorting domain-containing protein [Hymenobacter gelipurpurascens]|uniref:Por secretion system C-terminal sorting domain-containing protein n=1 Tax=Hymenobacter gelipurpurascens TaxID=89968 RepID=A0A212THR4_9BACT|nr:FG-GAP-like repeat-containing protein [Hymenobacter gelipurpurascens]SNC65366.1 Por secretion system C-terminal sorting domain-containing protein [Hymenobacter gelipurpurascens]
MQHYFTRFLLLLLAVCLLQPSSAELLRFETEAQKASTTQVGISGISVPLKWLEPAKTTEHVSRPSVPSSNSFSLPFAYAYPVAVSTATGSGNFGGGSNVPVGGNPNSVRVGDVDGDGDLDLLTANGNSGSVSVRLNGGIGGFSGGSDLPIIECFSVCVGDVDGDGDLDLLAPSYSSSTVSVRLNDGVGSFSGGSDVPTGRSPASVAVGDVDGDGDLDLLTPNTNGGSVSVRLNDGVGGFSGGSDVPVGNNPSSIVVRDLDGDGDLDLLTADYSYDIVKVRLNDGSGSFSGGSNVPISGGPISVAVGDVDMDGDLDFLTANYFNRTVSVRLNDGSGGFSGGSNVPMANYVRSVAVGDVDGDGDLDLLAAFEGSNMVSVQLNNGSGGFREGSYVPVGTYPSSVCVGDVDGDGDLDLLTANTGSGSVSVRLNLPPNNAPVANAQNVSTAEDVAKDITLSGTDADGNALTYSIDTPPVHGTLSGTGATRTYTPNTNYNGSDSFTFTVSDGILTSVPATVSVTITAVNDAPVLAGVPASASIPRQVLYSFTASATDVEGSALMFSLQGAPAGASINSTTGALSWTPSASQAGASYTFAVRVTDGSLTASQNTTLTVLKSVPVPSINSFAPSSGPVGTSVLLTGVNFEGTSGVTFNGVRAAYKVQDATSILTMVPPGAKTGKITVTAPGGTATSKGQFKVTAGTALMATQTQLAYGEVVQGEMALQASPNPFRDRISLRFSLAEEQAYELRVYDLRGALVQVLRSGSSPAGQLQEVEWDASTCAEGLYLIHLNSAGRSQNLKVLLTR